MGMGSAHKQNQYLVVFIRHMASRFSHYLHSFSKWGSPEELDEVVDDISRLLRGFLDARRLGAVPFRRRVRQPFLAAAERFSFEARCASS